MNWQKFLSSGLEMKTFILTRRDLSSPGLQKIKWMARKIDSNLNLGFCDIPIFGYNKNTLHEKHRKHTMEINDCCLFGPSWGSSWSALGASLGPLEPSWRHLGPSWRLWWPPMSVLEAVLGIWDVLESARDVSGRRQSLGKRGRFLWAGASKGGGGPSGDYRNPVRQHLAF